MKKETTAVDGLSWRIMMGMCLPESTFGSLPCRAVARQALLGGGGGGLEVDYKFT